MHCLPRHEAPTPCRPSETGTGNDAPNVFEVEFSDDQGRTYASLALRAGQLMVLHYQPMQAA
ncbi:MAG: DUF4926 domain-containing protein [Chloroflexota bacterium]|nr:MAG: DUF4926 domain-containing protein [Chloroflexota bacterium]